MTAASRRSVIVEADGGSRGNPGPSAYGALLKDADTGEVIAERGESDRGRHQQRRGVPRPDRRARARRRARAGGRDRGPDGLQAGRRADGRQLEDQAPVDEAAGDRGQPARAGRHDVHLGAARGERARRPAGQRGARRAARRDRAAGPDGRRRWPAVEAPDRTDALGRIRRREAASAAGARPGKPTTLVLVRHGVTDAHHRQAVLRRAGQQQPAAERRGPRAGAGDGGVAGAAGRARSTRWSARRCGVPARPRRSWPSSSTSRSRRSPASPRWSSAPGTG